MGDHIICWTQRRERIGDRKSQFFESGRISRSWWKAWEKRSKILEPRFRVSKRRFKKESKTMKSSILCTKRVSSMKKEILLINIQLILNPWFWLLLCERFSKTIGESFVDSVTLVIFLHLFFWWLSSVVVALAYANLFIIPPKHIFLSLIFYHLFCIFRTLIILSVSSRIVYALCKSLSTSGLKVDYEWIW